MEDEKTAEAPAEPIKPEPLPYKPNRHERRRIAALTRKEARQKAKKHREAHAR